MSYYERKMRKQQFCATMKKLCPISRRNIIRLPNKTFSLLFRIYCVMLSTDCIMVGCPSQQAAQLCVSLIGCVC